MISQMINGAPKAVVIAFKGNVLAMPGSWLMVSQASKITTPKLAAAGKSNAWFWVRKSSLARCGTAMPIKAMGPQKAVMLPVSMPVLTIITQRNR